VWAVLAVAVLALVYLVWARTGTDDLSKPTGTPALGPAPVDVSPQLWQDVLGGDEGTTPDALKQLSDPASSDLSRTDFIQATQEAAEVAAAALTGPGRDAFPRYFTTSAPEPPQVAPPAFCTGLDILASSAVAAPSDDGRQWAKAVVVFTGQCPSDDAADATYPGALQLFLVKDKGTWVPVDIGSVPGAAPSPPTSIEVDAANTAWIVDAGGGIQVDRSIAPKVSTLLAAAAKDGIVFTGIGHQDIKDQVARRQANCGTSDYAVYDMPADQCNPPTAKPGASLHEQGLAVDFLVDGVLVTEGSVGFDWLSRHAGDYGLKNYTNEPWHWSTTGA
jgi:hypothetical protein